MALSSKFGENLPSPVPDKDALSSRDWESRKEKSPKDSLKNEEEQ